MKLLNSLIFVHYNILLKNSRELFQTLAQIISSTLAGIHSSRVNNYCYDYEQSVSTWYDCIFCSASELISVDKTTTNNPSSYKSSSDLDETESLHSTKKSVVSEALFRPTKVCIAIHHYYLVLVMVCFTPWCEFCPCNSD